MRRYAWLLACAVALAAGLGFVARRPQRSVADLPEVAARDTVDLVLRVARAGVEPERSAVPKGRVVRLRVRNLRAAPITLSLQGYADRVTSGSLAPDSLWQVWFIADRPGEDFAWIVEGKPMGRLVVSGSHLVEGHR